MAKRNLYKQNNIQFDVLYLFSGLTAFLESLLFP